MPSLLKGDSSRIKSSKLKPLDDKLSHGRLAEKQQHMEQQAQANVLFNLFQMEWIHDLSKKEQHKI